jgi:serine/threonine protein kinase
MSEPLHNIGRYEVLGEIGRGGMAVVYRSRHFELERIDALKALHGVADGGPDIARRFLHEARVAGGLSHPNVVTVYDYFESSGTPYIAMEFLERGSLRPYVGKLTFPQIGGVLADVLAGLAHAERRRVVHRDLKPENLLVTEEGRVKIADFGIAKATSDVGAAAFRTATGVTVGTPGYMAPEQAMAQEIGPWTDLYSVGCMAYEMCVGQLPFSDSEGPIALLLRHVNEPIPPARSVNPEVNADFSRWIDGLLVKEPERRTPSPAVAWEALEEILITAIGPRWRRAAALADEVPTDDAQPIPHFQSSILPNEELVAQLAPPTPPPAVETPSDPAVTVAPRTQPALEPRRPRRVRLVAAGALVVVIAAVALALALGGGGGDRRPAKPPTVAQGVRRLASILDFSAAGNLLSKKHEYSAAVRNRTEVARQLARFQPPQALRAATQTLTRVTRLAIQFNRQRASGQGAKDVDSQANALRHEFLGQFNPYAQRYLHRTYDIGEF